MIGTFLVSILAIYFECGMGDGRVGTNVVVLYRSLVYFGCLVRVSGCYWEAWG